MLCAVLVMAARRSRGAGAGAGAGSGRESLKAIAVDDVRESPGPTFKAYPNDLTQQRVSVGGMGGSGAGSSSMGAMGGSFRGIGGMSANLGGSGASLFGNCEARFAPRPQNELSRTAGDRLELVNAIDRDWPLCRNERGQQGMCRST
jgi:hypothetical protein